MPPPKSQPPPQQQHQQHGAFAEPTSTGLDDRPRQPQSTSHILKTGRRGNPFVKVRPGASSQGSYALLTRTPPFRQDTHDLFSTLVASLQLGTNTRFFKSYPNSFTTDDAAANLASLRFSQSNRSTDPNDPSRIVTTTTTTTFSMNREIAKGICQHFMDARLIENAADPLNPTFKERGIYSITPKGLHVLERFITKNGIHADHLVRVFTTQPICMKLLHLERRVADDEIHITPNVVHVVFRRFSGGRQPNYVVSSADVAKNALNPKGFVDNARPSPNFDRSLGVEIQDVRERNGAGASHQTSSASSAASVLVRQVFLSTSAIDWLVDFSTCCCREEAAELLAHFVRYNLIALHSDRSKAGDRVVEMVVRAPSGEAKGVAASEGEFRYGPRITYRITDEGRRINGGDPHPSSASGHTGRAVPAGVDVRKGAKVGVLESDAGSTHSAERDDRALAGGTSLAATVESSILNRQPLREIFRHDSGDVAGWAKDATSSTARLRAILDEPALRSLFREFLRSHICEENLHYWIDVQEFRRRFATSSSAVGVHQAARKSGRAGNNATGTPSAMELHQEKLVSTALLIYNTYLAPMSPSELNIDHNLRGDVISYMSKAVEEVRGAPVPAGPLDMAEIPALRATQVQALLRHYERVADHIYRCGPFACPSLPTFC